MNLARQSNIKPYVEISIISKQDCSENESDILRQLLRRIATLDQVSVHWLGNQRNPTVRIIFPNIDYFTELYSQDFHVLEHTANILRKFSSKHIPLLKSREMVEFTTDEQKNQDIYLILRYRTNFKQPMRDSYVYKQWFIDRLEEKVWIEEIEDGFLHFYQTKEDFQRVILDLTQASEILTWYHMKKDALTPQFSRQLLSMIREMTVCH